MGMEKSTSMNLFRLAMCLASIPPPRSLPSSLILLTHSWSCLLASSPHLASSSSRLSSQIVSRPAGHVQESPADLHARGSEGCVQGEGCGRGAGRKDGRRGGAREWQGGEEEGG
eukprot:764306-Hanusia_phi.AAC.2